MFEKCCGASEATDDNTTWRMRITCWIPKATDTHAAYVILNACLWHQWLRERMSVFVIGTLPCCSSVVSPQSVFICGRTLPCCSSVVCPQSVFICVQAGGTIKADSHIACQAHAVPLSCRAAKGLECVVAIWFTQSGRVWFTLAMPCHSTARPSLDGRAVALRRRHGRSMAWAWLGKCESDTAALCKSNGKDTF